jgi:predicted phage tail protein
MIRNVHLHGNLFEIFGGPYPFDVDSPVEAIRALNSNFPGFYSAIRKGSYRIIRGSSIDSGEDLPYDMLTMGLGGADVHIVPIVEGAGGNSKGVITAVLGVALVGLSFGMALPATGGLAAGMQMAVPGTFGLMTWGQVGLMGGILALGGISQILSPAPKVSNYNDREQKQTTWLFSGPVNRTEQGGAVPLVYGEFEIGSTVISGGVSLEELDDDDEDAAFVEVVTFGDGGSVIPNGKITAKVGQTVSLTYSLIPGEELERVTWKFPDEEEIEITIANPITFEMIEDYKEVHPRICFYFTEDETYDWTEGGEGGA